MKKTIKGNISIFIDVETIRKMREYHLSISKICGEALEKAIKEFELNTKKIKKVK